MFSVTSSGICVSLLFCKFKVSSELRFSNTRGGSTLILERLRDDVEHFAHTYIGKVETLFDLNS